MANDVKAPVPAEDPPSLPPPAPSGIPGVDILQDSALNELSPLIARARATKSLVEAIRTDPQGFVVHYAKDPVLRLCGPIIAILPNIVEDVDPNCQVNPLKALGLELCILLKHSIPTFLAYMQEQSIQLAPIVSIGHLSTDFLAATTVATMVSNVTGYGVIGGLTGALDHVLDAKSPSSSFPGFWCFCTACILLVAIGPIATLWSTIDRPLTLLGQSPEMIRLTALNLRLTAIGIPAFAANEIIKRYLHCQGSGSVYTHLNTLAATLNVVLNYVLVYGPSSVRLGFAGAPVATAISHNFVVILASLYILFRPRATVAEGVAISAEMTERKKPSFVRGLGLIMFLGMGGIARVAAASWSKDILGFSTSILGSTSLATQAVLMATTSTALQAPRSIGECAQRRLTVLLNAGHVNRARIAVLATAFLTLSCLLGICNVLLIWCHEWSKIFTGDDVVNAAVSNVLPLICLYIVAQGIGVCVDHLLRVFQKPLVYPGLTLSADYLGGMPLGLWLAFNEGWGLYGLWVGLTASLVWSFVVALIVLVRCDWPSA
ncbi:hypothetical protein BXZ70DRAFT_1008689 [Cristinia sonorae]|uniref:MATE efflux family protein n=1 Tax=Cristinia sonorae TaxID=1940300 RepID=A0A8K0XPL8_9AGAR|nr:hypothetical protein BXZ70DRAFT_1008689 [Cristinia sonorae]